MTSGLYSARDLTGPLHLASEWVVPEWAELDSLPNAWLEAGRCQNQGNLTAAQATRALLQLQTSATTGRPRGAVLT
jgi:hypothetical protein